VASYTGIGEARFKRCIQNRDLAVLLLHFLLRSLADVVCFAKIDQHLVLLSVSGRKVYSLTYQLPCHQLASWIYQSRRPVRRLPKILGNGLLRYMGKQGSGCTHSWRPRNACIHGTCSSSYQSATTMMAASSCADLVRRRPLARRVSSNGVLSQPFQTIINLHFYLIHLDLIHLNFTSRH